ncbi:MAG: DUF3793 family protein [Spirochaetaceae bacterium]|nr:DUF3793 family protein [Spirochaetaceae bacterium]
MLSCGDINKRLLAQTFGLIPRLPEESQQLEVFLRWAAGPAIAGIKPASLISILQSRSGETWESCGAGICRGLGISAFPLRKSPRSTLVLLFRRRLLARKVLTGVPGRYLRSLAYPIETGPEACLGHLKARFTESDMAASPFPHEVGIFLGYPPEDVIGFCSGKPSPYGCRGYWKVYHRPEKAQRTFAWMDAARLKLTEDFLAEQLSRRSGAGRVSKGN